MRRSPAPRSSRCCVAVRRLRSLAGHAGPGARPPWPPSGSIAPRPATARRLRGRARRRGHALAAAPHDAEIREMAARIALVRLDYPEVIRLTEGLNSTAAHGLRGRAFWFSGDLEHAADELEAKLSDPEVKDAWARTSLRSRGGRRGGTRSRWRAASWPPSRCPAPSTASPSARPTSCPASSMASGSSRSSRRGRASSCSTRTRGASRRGSTCDSIASRSKTCRPSSRTCRPSPADRRAHQGAHRVAAPAPRPRDDRPRGDQFVVRRLDATPPARREPGSPRLCARRRDDAAAPPSPRRDGGRRSRCWSTARVRSRCSCKTPPGRRPGSTSQSLAGDSRRRRNQARHGPDLPAGRLRSRRRCPPSPGPTSGSSRTGSTSTSPGVVGADLLAFFRSTFADEGRFMWIEPDPTLVGPEQRPAPPASAPPAPTAPGAPSPETSR